jgi:hypothetical protein
MPDKAIPELQFISEKDWFDAVKSGKPLESDDDYRQALSDLRQNAKSGFARQFQEALKGYLKSTDGMLPADLSQLKPFFSIPVSDAALQRYSLLQTGKLADLPAGSRLIAETAPPVDEEYDTYFRIGVNGVDSHSVNRTEDAVEEAGMQFAKANQGLLPREVSQLAPYLQPGIDPTKAQSILNKIPAGITTVDQLKAAGMLAK